MDCFTCNFLLLLLLAANSRGQENSNNGPHKAPRYSFHDEPAYSKTFLNGILNIKSAMLVRDKSCFTRDSNRNLNNEKEVCKNKSNGNESTSSASCWPSSLFLSKAVHTVDTDSDTERRLRNISEEYRKSAKNARKVQNAAKETTATVQQENQNQNFNQNQNENLNQVQPQKPEGIINALKAHLSGTFNALTNGTGTVDDNNTSCKGRKKKSKKHPRKLNHGKYISRKTAKKYRKKKQRLNQKKAQIRREDVMDQSCVASPIDRNTYQKP